MGVPCTSGIIALVMDSGTDSVEIADITDIEDTADIADCPSLSSSIGTQLNFGVQYRLYRYARAIADADVPIKGLSWESWGMEKLEIKIGGGVVG